MKLVSVLVLLACQSTSPQELDVPRFLAAPVLTKAFAKRISQRTGCEHWMQLPKDKTEQQQWARQWESDSCGENWDVCSNGTLVEGGEIVRRRGRTMTLLPAQLLSSGVRMHLIWEESEWRLDETVCNPHRRLSNGEARRQLRRAAPKARGDPMAVVSAFWEDPLASAASALWQERAIARANNGEDARCGMKSSDVIDTWYRSIESTHVDIIVAGSSAFVYVRLVPEGNLWKVDSVVCEN